MKALGWLTGERMVGDRRAPPLLDWLVAFALVVIALLEAAGGVLPGPVAIAVAVQLAVIMPVAFRRVAPVRAIALSAAVLFLAYLVTYGVVDGTGGSVAAAGTQLLLVYSGRMQAGPVAGGGFRVEAVLPLSGEAA